MKRSANRKTFCLFFYLSVMALCFVSPIASAQSIQLPQSELTLAELIQQIEKQSDYFSKNRRCKKCVAFCTYQYLRALSD